VVLAFAGGRRRGIRIAASFLIVAPSAPRAGATRASRLRLAPER
jgi:hypothetical protein